MSDETPDNGESPEVERSAPPPAPPLRGAPPPPRPLITPGSAPPMSAPVAHAGADACPLCWAVYPSLARRLLRLERGRHEEWCPVAGVPLRVAAGLGTDEVLRLLPPRRDTR
ncbi:hypothetical protein [Streptomyces sp. CRN 30]|uniref:hypothetical protein n=1 Tax=Streptomyces sp. CRN 30 TaxID=3075613 RepID=UPI002A7ED031|nr:hypothetical protein [Streptomyces sp. CRN 30]